MRRFVLAAAITLVAVLALVLVLGAGSHTASSGSESGSGAGPVPRAAGPATHAAIGFSDEDPDVFAKPAFRLLASRLRIRMARLIVPYDNPAAAAGWTARARAAGQSPYLTLGADDSCTNPAGVLPATGNCPPPAAAAYAAGFVALVRAFPWVHDWGAWSEPSNDVYYPCATSHGAPPPAAGACASTRLGPQQAAGYWLAAEAADRSLGRSDTIVAGETGADCTAPAFNLCTSDGGRTWTGYVPNYLAGLGAARPSVWGTHSYHDLQRRPALGATETEQFVRYLNQAAGAPQVWLTEEGTWLEGPNGGLLDGDAAAQQAAAREFLALPLVPAARAGQVAREYYYLLQAKRDNGFDSALLDYNGVPRPAFCVLVGEPASDCRGQTTDLRGVGATAG
ncbi:MAG TPA: hypothetical protein VNR66_08120 [Solirubrobacteraceae bacterium]|nr:hypothetical protein [Solirubrobacteraceae bacterium]